MGADTNPPGEDAAGRGMSDRPMQDSSELARIVRERERVAEEREHITEEREDLAAERERLAVRREQLT
jgi:hypothetical protein